MIMINNLCDALHAFGHFSNKGCKERQGQTRLGVRFTVKVPVKRESTVIRWFL